MNRKPPCQIEGIGSSDVEDQIRQAVAIISLDGLHPSKRSISLVRAVAKGEMMAKDAVRELNKIYK